MRTRAAGRRWAGSGSVLVVAVVGVVLLAACGGGSSKAKTSPTSAAAASSSAGSNPDRQALQAYRTCLQQHGVTGFGRFGGRRNGNGGNDGNGGNGADTQGTGRPPTSRAPLSAADRAKLQAAQQACQSKLPSGFLQQRQQDLAAYRSCLRDHGVNVPATTDSTGGPGGFGGLGGIDRTDPKFQAANKICAPLLPSGGFGRGGGNGGPDGTATSGAPSAAPAPSAGGSV